MAEKMITFSDNRVKTLLSDGSKYNCIDITVYNSVRMTMDGVFIFEEEKWAKKELLLQP